MPERPTLDHIVPYPRHTRWTACTPERRGTMPKHVNHLRLAKDEDHRGNWLVSYRLSAGPSNN